MKLFIVYFISLFASILNAQSIKLEYEVTINRNTFMQSTKSSYYLEVSNSKSIYYNNINNTDVFFNIDWEPEIIDKTNEKVSLKISDDIYGAITQDYYYKDYKKDKLIYNDYYFKKKYIIKEPVDLFDWEIVQGKDTTILGYTCNKAICTFRGRKYEAYFCQDLLTYGGPWKFDGLPGLILSVHSTDNYFIIKPLEINVKNKRKDIANPYINKEDIICWDTFKEDAYKKARKLLSYIKTDLRAGESTSIINKDRIEDIGFYELSTDDL